MHPAEISSQRVLQVLLIEDDEDAQANLSDILGLDGYEISVAGTAKQGRQLATQLSPDVIILDRQLPDATADQLLPELRALIPMGDIIVVTGFADIESTIAALRQGASDYILKPINPGALRASLDRIVQRRRIEFALRCEQQLADRILQTAEAVILVLDLEGRIVSYNPYFERLTHQPLAEVIGQDWFELFLQPKDIQRIRDIFLKVSHDINTGGIINSVVTHEGTLRSIRWANTTLHDEQGNVSSVLSVGVDVTAYLAAQERAIQAERLATIGQTMTGLAHESRSALQRIQASLELLSLELTDMPECQDDLAKIQRATRDLNALLEEVRSYAAPILIQATPTNLVELWRRCWRDIESTRAGRDAQLVELIDGEEIVASVDEMRMEQVFRNLFDNAIAACADPVVVTVSCQLPCDGFVNITIADNGPGLSADQHERIFEPFYTTKSTGTGLGMAIVQRILFAHHGTITAVSPSTSGAELVIRLPCAAKAGNSIV